MFIIILMFWISAIVLFVLTGASFVEFITTTDKGKKVKLMMKSVSLLLCFLACLISGITSCTQTDSQAVNGLQVVTSVGVVIFCIVQFVVSLRGEDEDKDKKQKKW